MAVAAMILVEECRIRLDDPIEEWLPELGNRKVVRSIDGPIDDVVPANRSITVRDLLTLRSGYGELSLGLPSCPLARALTEAQLSLMTFPFPGTNDQYLKRLSEFPLAFQPGDRWLYHMSLDILGILVSRVSGKTLGDFMKERIFDPLSMDDTSFHVPKSKWERIPTCYGTDFPGTNLVVLNEGHRGYVSEPDVFESGAGGLASTAEDLATFGRMMMNFGILGGERILSRPTVELMTMDHVSSEQKSNSVFFPNFWDDHSWGLGVGLITKRTDIGNSPGRFGWDGAFGTSLWIDPKERLVGVLMAQRRPDDLAFPKSVRDFWTAAYQLIED